MEEHKTHVSHASAQQQPPRNPTTATMDLFNSTEWSAHINNLMHQWHVPGLAIAIVQNETVSSRGFGHATLEPPKPCTADTFFDIASSSKSLTAASVALLVDDDGNYPDVRWEAKMHDLLPDDFVMSKESYTEDVTVEDVLSHRTGLPSHDSSYLGIRATNPDNAKSVTRNLRSLDLAAPIRTKYMYCNLMFTVATHLIESLANTSFSEFLHKRIFTPLEMNSTNLQPDAARAAGLGERMATGYEWNEETSEFAVVPYVQSPEAQGAGSIITSVNDYIKWVRAMMDYAAPLNQKIVEGLIRPRIFEDADSFGDKLNPYTSWTGYAVGLETFFYRGIRVVKHDGLIDGFGSQHFFVPDFKFGGVILGNSGDSSNTISCIIMYELLDEVLKVPADQRVDWNARYLSLDQKDSEKDDSAKLRAELCPDSSTPEPQRIPLETYTGSYWNAGYHGMQVSTTDNALFVDATDRSFQFYLKFEHLCDQTMYIAHMINALDPLQQPEELKAEFRFEGERVVRMGIDLEEGLDGLIWFDKVEEEEKREVVVGR